MSVNYADFYLLNHLVNMIVNIPFDSVRVMVFDKIYGTHSPTDSIFETSMSSTLQLKAMHIFVSRRSNTDDCFIHFSSLVNVDLHPGACGFYSLIVPRALGSVLVRFDPTTMEPIRNEKTKNCIQCKAGERGLLLGMIGKSLLHAFDGYVNNPSGTSKKIVENIYKQGDRAFNTGKEKA